MRPVPFKESNLNMGAGDNPNTEDLPVAISLNSEMSEGRQIPFVVSCWKPTPEELAEINRTGEVWISTMGVPPPPVCLMGHNPFKFHGYAALDLTK